MHSQAYDFIAAARSRFSILEIGSRDINGGIRDLFPGWHFTGIDTTPGPGVDIVADGGTYDVEGRLFDLVICAETFEHARNWEDIIENAYLRLKNGGKFIGTAAGIGRPPHKCTGEPMPNPPTEYYENIDPEKLRAALESAKFYNITIDVQAEDVRWVCEK